MEIIRSAAGPGPLDGEEILQAVADALAHAIADGAAAAGIGPKSLKFFKNILRSCIETAIEDAAPGEFRCDAATRKSGNVPDLQARWAEDFRAENGSVCINDGAVADKIGKMLFAHVVTLARGDVDHVKGWPIPNVDPSHHGTVAKPGKTGECAAESAASPVPPPRSENIGERNFDGALEFRNVSAEMDGRRIFLVECKTRMRDNPSTDSYQIAAGGGKTMSRGDGWFIVLWRRSVNSKTMFSSAHEMLAAVERLVFIESAEFEKLKHKSKDTCRLSIKKLTFDNSEIGRNKAGAYVAKVRSFFCKIFF